MTKVFFPENILTIAPESDNNTVKVSINKLKGLSKFSSLELTLFLYLLDDTLDADSFKLLPYEEYIRDVEAGKRSSYQKIGVNSGKWLGIALGIIILAVFAIVKPEDIVSIESLVSILAVYTIGKELWTDIDSFLGRITKRLPVKWVDPSFYYERESFGTIQRFWTFSREKRVRGKTTLASKLDFVNHSNSKTVELGFGKNLLQSSKESQILNISFKNKSKSKLQKMGYVIGTKVSLNRNLLGISLRKEHFQLFDSSENEVGTISLNQKFLPNTCFIRDTVTLGRLKLYLKSKTKKGHLLLFEK